jgi:hypothetical protein
LLQTLAAEGENYSGGVSTAVFGITDLVDFKASCDFTSNFTSAHPFHPSHWSLLTHSTGQTDGISALPQEVGEPKKHEPLHHTR